MLYNCKKLWILPKGVHSSKSAMDGVNVCSNLYCFPLPFVLCMHVISSWSRWVKRCQMKNGPGYLLRMVRGYNLPSGSTSPGNISFQAFYFAKNSTQYLVFDECILWSLSLNKTLQSSTDIMQTAVGFFLTIDSSLLFYYISCRSFGHYNLPI